MGEDRQQRAMLGVFGIGLEAYWDQFGGLKKRLEGYRTLKIGNTNSRLRFSLPPAAFMTPSASRDLHTTAPSA